MESYTRRDFWDSASKAGLALGAVSIAYTMVSQMFTPEMIGKMGAGITTLITMSLWVAKFAGCIWLMKFFLKKFAGISSDMTRNEVFKQGAAAAFLSALIFSAFYLAYVTIINPEAFNQAMDTAIESYSSFMDSNTSAMMEEMRGKIPVISFVSNLIYCSIYGSVLASILSRNIISDNPFEGYES